MNALAQENVAASTQNQAFNAIIFFYKEALGMELKNVRALRARRPAQIRRAPTPTETWQLIKTVQRDSDFATSLAIRLLYGCGLRVCEPLNLRIKDVNLEGPIDHPRRQRRQGPHGGHSVFGVGGRAGAN